jgi:phosphatidate cytidylyltransferase
MNLSSELSKRIITGSIGAVVLIALIIWGGWIGICFLTAVLSLGMVNEYCQISLDSKDRVEKRYGMLLLTWAISAFNLLAPRSEYELLIGSFLILFSSFLFSAKGREGEEFALHFRELKYSAFGLLYLVFLPLYMTRIYSLVDGVHWTIVFFLIVWTGDTLAYFVGKKFGRKKLYPEISPKKTREGALGGLGFSVLIAVLYKLAFFKALTWTGAILIPCVVSVFAQIGDLCESFLKRAYGKKDSGGILPGHGGFLDRFDGVVFSLPVMYACIKLFG